VRLLLGVMTLGGFTVFLYAPEDRSQYDCQ
jgi:hypothetical protein